MLFRTKKNIPWLPLVKIKFCTKGVKLGNWGQLGTIGPYIDADRTQHSSKLFGIPLTSPGLPRFRKYKMNLDFPDLANTNLE